MAKPDNDATMEVSTSQLVVDDPPAPKRSMPPPSNKNDASMWAYRVVGTDDFAPTPAKGLAAARPRVRVWLLVVFVLVALAAGGYIAFVM